MGQPMEREGYRQNSKESINLAMCGELLAKPNILILILFAVGFPLVYVLNHVLVCLGEGI